MSKHKGLTERWRPPFLSSLKLDGKAGGGGALQLPHTGDGMEVLRGSLGAPLMTLRCQRDLYHSDSSEFPLHRWPTLTLHCLSTQKTDYNSQSSVGLNHILLHPCRKIKWVLFNKGISEVLPYFSGDPLL